MWKVQTDLRLSRVQALGTSFPLFSRMLVHLLCLEKREGVGGDYAWTSSSRPEYRATGTCQVNPLPLILSAPTTTTNCSPGHLEVACDFNNPLSYPPPGIHSWFPPVRPGATPTRLKANGKCRHQGQVATCPGHSRGAQGHSGWAVTAPPPAPSPVSLSSPQDHRGFTGMGEHCCTQDSLSCWELSEWPLNMPTVGFW